MRLFQTIVGAGCALLAMSGLAWALVKIDVDLSNQTMHVATSEGENYDWPISSGKIDHATPRGQFRPTRLYPIVYSSKYNNAPMPHAIFFHGGYAIHGTNAVGALGRPASHGCIRLSPANAATLYAKVKAQGAVISIAGEAPTKRSSVAMRRNHREAPALAYAPRRRLRSLDEWSADPIGGDYPAVNYDPLGSY
jgi:hypothetical protein